MTSNTVGNRERVETMIKQLNGVREKLIAAIERAETLADSENEDTASKYENVTDALNSALEAIDEAIAEHEDS